jgi:hypothetical protein
MINVESRSPQALLDMEQDLRLLKEAIISLIQLQQAEIAHDQSPQRRLNIELLVETLEELSDLKSTSMMPANRQAAFDLVRRTYRLHAALNTADWWTSPGGNLPIREFGNGQPEREGYMRSSGCEEMTEYASFFAREFFNIVADQPESFFEITSSGMSAFQFCLTFCATFRIEPGKIAWHRGVYSELSELTMAMFPKSREVSAAQVYEQISIGEIDLFILEPNNNWPLGPSVCISSLLEAIASRSTFRPFFLIVDQTHCGPFLKHTLLMNQGVLRNTILFLFGSHIKYHQIGLDIANAGYVLVLGRLLAFKKYFNILTFLRQALNIRPAVTILKSLPRIPVQAILEWMNRINRNTEIYLNILSELPKSLPGTLIFSIRNEVESILVDSSWYGGLIFIQLSGHDTFESYDVTLRAILEHTNGESFGVGMSFGFPRTRLSIARDYVTQRIDNCALRIAIGADNLDQVVSDANYLKTILQQMGSRCRVAEGHWV